MNNSNRMVVFSVALYVLFFAIALWSALPSSVTGSTSGIASAMEQQLVACDLPTGAVAGQESSQPKSDDLASSLASTWFSRLLDESAKVVYQCALMTGGLHN